MWGMGPNHPPLVTNSNCIHKTQYWSNDAVSHACGAPPAIHRGSAGGVLAKTPTSCFSLKTFASVPSHAARWFLKKMKLRITLWITSNSTHIVERVDSQVDTCTSLFIYSGLHKTQRAEGTQCPMTNGWVKKMWSAPKMEYYLALKRN